MSVNAFPPPMILGGTVAPSTFLKISSAADRTLLQAGANDAVFGISGVGTNTWQLSGNALGNAGVAGELPEYYMDGEPCLLLAGAGGWNPKDYLKSDASGKGVVGAIGVDNIGAQALEATAAGNYGKVVPSIQPAAGAGASSGKARTVTAATSLTAADAGTTIFVNAPASVIISLPPAASLSPGASGRVVGLTATSSGAGLIVAPSQVLPDTAYVYGDGFTSLVAGKGAKNTQATSKAGDLIDWFFDGTNFLITSVVGTWVVQP